MQIKQKLVLPSLFVSISILSICILPANAQTYLGVGYAGTYNITESVIDDAYGVVIITQREVSLGNSYWRLIPTLHTALLFSKLGDDNFPAHTSVLSLSPLIAYDLIRFKKVTLTPYLGPALTWLASINADQITVDNRTTVFDLERINRLQEGFEMGLAAYFQITDQFRIKLVPLSVQYGQDSFRQGMIILSFEL